jgi:hypothetical protein
MLFSKSSFLVPQYYIIRVFLKFLLDVEQNTLQNTVCYISFLSVLNFFLLLVETLSQHSIIVIVTRLWVGWSRVWIWAGSKRFFSCPKCPNQLWGPHSPNFSGYLGYFLEVDWLGHEVDLLPPCTTNIMNEWNYTPYSCDMPSKHEPRMTLCDSFSWSGNQQFCRYPNYYISRYNLLPVLKFHKIPRF